MQVAKAAPSGRLFHARGGFILSSGVTRRANRAMLSSWPPDALDFAHDRDLTLRHAELSHGIILPVVGCRYLIPIAATGRMP